MQTTDRSVTLIDADGLILGRMASLVAKRLLTGEEIVILNAEKAVLSGKKRSKVREGKVFLEVGAPERGPFHYKKPDRIVRKTVRGMLPIRLVKGKQAYKRLKVFVGIPGDFRNQKMETLLNAQTAKLTCPFFTVGEFSKEMGWTPEE